MSKTIRNSASPSPHQGRLALYLTVTIIGATVMVLKPGSGLPCPA